MRASDGVRLAAARAVIVTGLGFGDEGKGSIVDWLVRAHGHRAVARFTGGPQAAHHVVDPDGRLHCFSQLPAGLMMPDARGLLAAPMLVEPLALLRENETLVAAGFAAGVARLAIDPACLVVTPWQKLLGRLRETLRGAGRYGTVGLGVGQTVADAETVRREGGEPLRIGDLWRSAGGAVGVRAGNRGELAAKVRWIAAWCLDRAEQLLEEACREPRAAGGANPAATGPAGRLAGFGQQLAELRDPAVIDRWLAAIAAAGPRLAPRVLPDPGAVADWVAAAARHGLVLEGAQGALLDPMHGRPPHVTKTPATVRPARELLARAGVTGPVFALGVLRAYATRHGPGPLPTERPGWAGRWWPEPHNGEHEWQGRFRVGWFDGVLARHAVAANPGLDGVAITLLDAVLPAGAPGASAARRHPPHRLGRLVAAVDRADGEGPFAGEPVYRALVGRDPVGLATELAELVGMPLAAISTGPTWRDKRAAGGREQG